MSETYELRLPQEVETAATIISGARFHLQYAYARSADSQSSNDRGQDYLVIRTDEARLAFALCDGVSQSFVGDLAARVLGNALVEWLWQLEAGQAEPAALQQAGRKFLTGLVPAAAGQVQDYALPPGLPTMVQDVLAQKRGLGSESTFAAGLLDTRAGSLILLWMGDSRLRLWGSQRERAAELTGAFHTHERWSTRRGLIGELHVLVTGLDDVQRIVTYSDGLAIVDHGLDRPLTRRALDNLIDKAINMPNSDDISFLEVSFCPFPEAEVKPRPHDEGAKKRGRAPEKAGPSQKPQPRGTGKQTSGAPGTVSPLAPATALTQQSRQSQPPRVRSQRTRIKRLERICFWGAGAVLALAALVLLTSIGMLLIRHTPPALQGFLPSVEEPTTTPQIDGHGEDTYVIMPLAGSGGSISPRDPLTVSYGSKITVTITPGPGYCIREIRVNGDPQPVDDPCAILNYSIHFVDQDYEIRAMFKSIDGTPYQQPVRLSEK